MTTTRRTVAFLHTSPIHIPTFDDLMAERLSGVETTHLVDESLLADARQHGLTDDLGQRVTARLAELASESPAVIACTCSTIGALAEAAAVGQSVLRIDRAMASRAIALATDADGSIGVAAALASTLDPTLGLLASAAHDAGVCCPSFVAIPCLEAWADFERSDLDAYGRAIAATIRPVADHHAVIVLAQASMAVARPFLTDIATPILTSPDQLVDVIAATFA
ncbi:MAG: hypothetical protein QM753_09050 [Thermomicrobiales bacterium]